MDKREAGIRLEELNRELAGLMATIGVVQEKMMKLTTNGKEQNWTMARYQDERAPLMAEKTALGEKMKQLMDERASINAILGV